VIVLDDVHAADEATIDAIAYLARRIGERRLLLALTWPNEGVPPGHRLPVRCQTRFCHAESAAARDWSLIAS
jgi:hypothetical protein